MIRGFRLIDYLAKSSDVSQSEKLIDKRFAGTTPLFAIIKLDKSIAMLDEKNRDIFYGAKTHIDSIFPSTSSYSLDDFAKEVAKGGGHISEADIDELPEYMTSRFYFQRSTRNIDHYFFSRQYNRAPNGEETRRVGCVIS